MWVTGVCPDVKRESEINPGKEMDHKDISIAYKCKKREKYKKAGFFSPF